MANKLYLFLLLGLLSACVPVRSTVYLAPKWSGTIIDASNLRPIGGVHVEHVLSWDKYIAPRPNDAVTPDNLEYFSDVTPVKSDAKGFFNLPSMTDSILEFRLPVTGMMYTNAALSLKADGYKDALIIGRNMRYGDDDMNVNHLKYIALDPTPQVLAPIPFGESYLDIRNLKSITENCNQDMWQLAERKLNTARKLVQTIGWEKLDERSALNQYQSDIIYSAYSRVSYYWAHAKRSCQSAGPKDRDAIKSIMDKLMVEIDTILGENQLFIRQ